MKKLQTNQKKALLKFWTTSLIFLVLAACVNRQTEHLQAPPTVSFTEQQFIQNAVTDLGENHFRFNDYFGSFEFSLPETWKIDNGKYIFNAASSRETFTFYRDPIFKDQKKFVPEMFLIFPGYIVETAEENHEYFRSVACWCCTDNGIEEVIPSNLLVSPSAVGYTCTTTDHIRYTVYEKRFLYGMVSPIEIFSETENEIFYFFQSVSYK